MEKTISQYSDDNFKMSLMTIFDSIYERKIRDVRINLEKLTPIGNDDKPDLVKVSDPIDNN